MSAVTPTPARKRNGNIKPLSTNLLNLKQDDLRVRKGHLLTLLSISSTTLAKRIADGVIPPPDGHDGRVRKTLQRPYWRAETIRNFLKQSEQ